MKQTVRYAFILYLIHKHGIHLLSHDCHVITAAGSDELQA